MPFEERMADTRLPRRNPTKGRIKNRRHLAEKPLDSRGERIAALQGRHVFASSKVVVAVLDEQSGFFRPFEEALDDIGLTARSKIETAIRKERKEGEVKPIRTTGMTGMSCQF